MVQQKAHFVEQRMDRAACEALCAADPTCTAFEYGPAGQSAHSHASTIGRKRTRPKTNEPESSAAQPEGLGMPLMSNLQNLAHLMSGSSPGLQSASRLCLHVRGLRW